MHEVKQILCVNCVLCNCACFEHNSYKPIFLYSGCHDILNTDEQLDLRYILYFKTFAPQCEVKIIVFIILLIDANYATFYFTLL